MDPALLKQEKVELTPAQLRTEWKTSQTRSQGEIVKSLHLLGECCVGVQGVTLLTGTNKFEASFQGFDVFEVLPEFAYLLESAKEKAEELKLQQEEEEKEKLAGEEEEAGGGEEKKA